MRLRHIEVFHAVMVSQSVSGAAQLLSVTQSAVSQALHHAELQLGFALFKKHKQRLVPTEFALALYPEVQVLFKQLEQVKQMARNLQVRPLEHLRVMIVPSLTRYVLPNTLKSLQAKYQHLQIEVNTNHSQEIIECVRLRDVDVGVIYGDCVKPDVSCVTLAQNPLVYVSPGATPLASLKTQATQGLCQLHQQKIVTIANHDPVGLLLSTLCAQLSVQFVSEVTVNAHQTAVELVQQGFGSTIVDVCSVAGLLGQPFAIAQIEPMIPVNISAVWHFSRDDHALIMAFVQAVKQTLDDLLVFKAGVK